MSHANAPLTPEGRRRLASLIIDEHWPIRRAAERFQVSPATASKWAARYHANESLDDRSSRPARCPTRLCRKREHRIIALRFNRQWGPHRISYHLGHCRTRPDPLPDAQAGISGPGHRPAGAQTDHRALREAGTRRAGACGHQETGPHPRGRRLARPWSRISPRPPGRHSEGPCRTPERQGITGLFVPASRGR